MSQVIGLDSLRNTFADRLILKTPLAPYTAARIGGPTDVLVVANSVPQLVQAADFLWRSNFPFTILGGGSNVLVSDDGFRGVVLLNRAKGVRFKNSDQPSVWAESGVNFGALARLVAKKGLGGLEWAAGIPGTVGGAIVGNAGAYGSDVSGTLKQVEIYHFELGQVTWPVEYLDYKYRDSNLKHMSGKAIVLSGEFQLLHSKPELINELMERFLAHRRRTQPPGASIGSMFKNPPGNYAGRLIDAAGLKGTRVGDVEISPLHANFFINHGKATAKDVYQLIQIAHDRVFEQFCVDLELEIELVGDW